MEPLKGGMNSKEGDWGINQVELQHFARPLDCQHLPLKGGVFSFCWLEFSTDIHDQVFFNCYYLGQDGP